MSGVEVHTVNLTEVVSYFKQLPESMFAVARTELATSLFEADALVKKNTTLKRRSGNLMKSIATEVDGSSIATLHGSIHTKCIYALIHEKGGTVNAKNAYKRLKGGPYLNIPTDLNKTAAGVQRMTAKAVFAAGGKIGYDESGKYGVLLNGQLMFTFAKSVTIPARLNMVSSVEGVVPTLLSRIASKVGE